MIISGPQGPTSLMQAKFARPLFKELGWTFVNTEPNIECIFHLLKFSHCQHQI
jgi:hypothetical protein